MRNAILAAGVLCSLLFFFQNCGSNMKSTSNSSTAGMGTDGGTSTGPGPGTPVGPNGFKVGDAFSLSALPSQYRSQMVDQMVATMTGRNGTAVPQSVAIASNGQGYARWQASGSTQAEVDQLALQSCYAITARPCALIASAGKFVINQSDLASAFSYVLSAPATLSASIPFLTASEGSAAFASYSAATGNPKVLVVSIDNHWTWESSATGFVETLDQVRQHALEVCEFNAGAGPCTVMAENNTIVFNPLQLNRTFAINYATNSIAMRPPTTNFAFFTQSIVPNYKPSATLHGVIYINGAGGCSYATNAVAATADSTALATCNGYNAGTCFKWASDTTVTPIASFIKGPATYGMDYYCKAIPRLSCANHKAAGCPAGNYYTMTTGIPALENCL